MYLPDCADLALPNAHSQVGITEMQLTQYMDHIMSTTGATSMPGSCVISCFIDPNKRYAFVEFR
jgi:hypothetical protein